MLGKATHLCIKHKQFSVLACGLVHSLALRTFDINKVNCRLCQRTKIYKEQIKNKHNM